MLDAAVETVSQDGSIFAEAGALQPQDATGYCLQQQDTAGREIQPAVQPSATAEPEALVGILKNARHEKFALGLAEGKSQEAA